MATRETRALHGRRRGQTVLARALAELATGRELAGLSHEQLGQALNRSPSAVRRLLGGELEDAGVIQLSEVASVLGMEMSVGLHPVGDPVRDKGQLAVGRRLDAMLSAAWRVTNETLLPGAGEQRAWDKLLRLVAASPPYLVGVDIETRVRDVQALTRRTRGRERDGMVDAIVIVLSDSATNRRVIDELRKSLGSEYSSSARAMLGALRSGQRLIGSGVVLI